MLLIEAVCSHESGHIFDLEAMLLRSESRGSQTLKYIVPTSNFVLRWITGSNKTLEVTRTRDTSIA